MEAIKVDERWLLSGAPLQVYTKKCAVVVVEHYVTVISVIDKPI
jgi:hypothetical protein